MVKSITSTKPARPGDGIECCHPRCSAPPQSRYEFPIPLCGRHIVAVLNSADAVLQDARRESVILNQKALPVRARDNAEFGHGAVVYYLRFGDRIKIGTTTNLRKRLGQIPHDEVLAVEPGNAALERMRHMQFAEHRINGEWFAASDTLLRHIGKLKAST